MDIFNRNIVKKEEIEDDYSFEEFQTDSMMGCIDPVSDIFEIIDISMEDNMITEVYNQQSQNNSIYSSSNDQWNTTTENIMTNESESILPCSYICETSLNEIALSTIDCFETNSNNGLCDVGDIDNLDLDLLLEDNVIQDINNYSMNDVEKMYPTTNESKKISEVCKIKNDCMRKHLMVNIMNKLKKNKESCHYKSGNSSRVESFESNDTSKASTYILNNMLKQQFSIFDDLDTLPYLPLPAMQLMIALELSDNSHKDINEEKKKSVKSDINKKCTIQLPSSANIVKSKNHKVCQKTGCVINEKVKSSNFPPIIPLSVIHYMNIIEKNRSTQTKTTTKHINDW